MHPTARLVGPVVLHRDVLIEERAVVMGPAVIGAGVTIGRDAVIHPHATIYPNVQIGDRFTCHSHASHCTSSVARSASRNWMPALPWYPFDDPRTVGWLSIRSR